LPTDQSDTVDVKVYDEGFSGEDPIGGCSIMVSQVNTGAGTKNWYTLLYKNKKAGII